MQDMQQVYEIEVMQSAEGHTQHLPRRPLLLLQESLRTRHMLSIVHEGRASWIQGVPHVLHVLVLHLPLLLNHVVALH